MKKLYFLLLSILICGMSFGQTPIITTIIDGPCSGGQPKVIEVYASGTVDFNNYVLVRRTNANPWDNMSNTTLAALGTRTDEFVYLIGSADTADFQGEYPAIPAGSIFEDGFVSGNGDDSFRIVTSDLATVVDEFGGAVDGTGETWEYLDSWGKRTNGTGPDSSFVESNWSFGGPNALDGLGVCNAAASISTLVSLGDFTLSTNDFEASKFSLYPNPTSSGFVTVKSSLSGAMNISVFDVLGKQVLNQTLTDDNRLNVSGLNTGIYVMRISQNSNTVTKKLVIR